MYLLLKKTKQMKPFINRFVLSVALSFLFLTFSSWIVCANTLAAENTQEQIDSQAADWFFRAIATYPAGVTFEPIVLFKNGDYVEIEDEPLEDLNKESDKQKRPKAWGTWKKEGSTYYLTNSQGKTTDYQLGKGNWFPAYPYMQNVPLAKGYENTTGGDYGNGTSALFKTRIDFPATGHFYHSSKGGILTPGSTAWSKSADAGTYTIRGHIMELKYNSGKVVRLSFALGAKGTPPAPSSKMVFIGGDVFIAD